MCVFQKLGSTNDETLPDRQKRLKAQHRHFKWRQERGILILTLHISKYLERLNETCMPENRKRSVVIQTILLFSSWNIVNFLKPKITQVYSQSFRMKKKINCLIGMYCIRRRWIWGIENARCRSRKGWKIEYTDLFYLNTVRKTVQYREIIEGPFLQVLWPNACYRSSLLTGGPTPCSWKFLACANILFWYDSLLTFVFEYEM